MRYLFEVSYFGRNYNGWQIQKNAISVQQVLEEAFSTLLRLDCKIVGSGRTDTGVHALQQYFHIDLDTLPPNFVDKLNSYLPDDISIIGVKAIIPDGHARYSAVSRSYKYYIHQTKDPFAVGRSYYFRRSLDLDNMNKAAETLVGRYDFKSFSKVKTDVTNFICDLTSAKWQEEGSSFIFHVSANRFLRGMVRALVGTLLLVGENKITNDEFVAIREQSDRTKAGQNVPPEGLYLSRVEYPKEIFM